MGHKLRCRFLWARNGRLLEGKEWKASDALALGSWLPCICICPCLWPAERLAGRGRKRLESHASVGREWQWSGRNARCNCQRTHTSWNQIARGELEHLVLGRACCHVILSSLFPVSRRAMLLVQCADRMRASTSAVLARCCRPFGSNAAFVLAHSVGRRQWFDEGAPAGAAAAFRWRSSAALGHFARAGRPTSSLMRRWTRRAERGCWPKRGAAALAQQHGAGMRLLAAAPSQ